MSRPAIAAERLTLTAQGDVQFRLKTPYRDGTTHIVLEPLDFMARLAALVPPPEDTVDYDATDGCGGRSRRVQSRYRRRPTDLPVGGRRVELSIMTRRFWCDGVLCGRRIFCERFDDSVLGQYSRRTQRLETIVHHLGLALGGRPAASFADRLMIPVSKDTLLRVVRRRVTDHNDRLTVIGIDDFAFRRGQTYGTIVCDLERRRPVVLLPDRALNTSRAWLAEHPSISVVARDRGGGYGEAIARGLPNADQVADRWHLMENSSRAFLDAVGKSMRQIRQAVGSNVVDPKLLTYAERLQYEGYLRRQETNEAIKDLWLPVVQPPLRRHQSAVRQCRSAPHNDRRPWLL